MSQEATITKMTEEDIPTCAELMRFSWDEHTQNSNLMPREHMLRAGGAESWAERMLADPSYVVLCAKQGDEVIGFMSTQITDAPGYLKADKQLYIIDIVTAKSAQHQGVASLLVKAAETEAKRAGAGIILSDIYPYNQASKNLFTKHGHSLAYEVWHKYLN